MGVIIIHYTGTNSSPSKIETRGFQFPPCRPYDSLEYLVFRDEIWCRWVRGFPSNEGYNPLETLFYRYWLV